VVPLGAPVWIAVPWGDASITIGCDVTEATGLAHVVRSNQGGWVAIEAPRLNKLMKAGDVISDPLV